MMALVEYSLDTQKKDGRILVIAAALITGLRLARDPRAGSKTERVIYAIEDGEWLANEIYDRALERFGRGHMSTSGSGSAAVLSPLSRQPFQQFKIDSNYL